MSGLAFHQANGSDAAAVTYNTVNGVYGGQLWNADDRQDRGRHQRRRGPQGDGRARQPDEAARAEGLGQLVHRRGQRRDLPGQGVRRLQLDRRDRRPASTRSSPRSARRPRRSRRSSASPRCPKQDADVVPLGGMGMHVSKYAPAEDQAEALNFIKWFEQPEIQKKWAAAGGVPSRKDALASPEFLEANPWNKVYAESVPAPARHVERPRVREAHQHREHQRQRRAERGQGPAVGARRHRRRAAEGARREPGRRASSSRSDDGRARLLHHRRRRPSWRRRRRGACAGWATGASPACSSRPRSRCCCSSRSSRSCGRCTCRSRTTPRRGTRRRSGSGSATTSTSSRRAGSASARSRRRSTSSGRSGCRPCSGFTIAYLISRRVRGRGLLTTLFLVPMMLSPVVVGLFWRFMLDTQFGVVNSLLGTIGLGPGRVADEPAPRALLGDHRRHLAVDAVHHADRARRAHRGAPATSTRPRRSTAPRSGSASATSRCPWSGRSC